MTWRYAGDLRWESASGNPAAEHAREKVLA
jgi:hypothetical protein